MPSGGVRVLLIGALAALLVIGCGSNGGEQGSGDGAPEDSPAADGPTGDSPTGDGAMPVDASGDGRGMDASIDSSSDGRTGNDAESDAPGDARGDGSAIVAHGGLALAAGAVVCASPSYKLIATLGQGPADNHNASSPSYRLVGGLVGATQAP
jgi:hypothetical protein